MGPFKFVISLREFEANYLTDSLWADAKIAHEADDKAKAEMFATNYLLDGLWAAAKMAHAEDERAADEREQVEMLERHLF